MLFRNVIIMPVWSLGGETAIIDKQKIVGYNNSIQMNEVDAMAKERDMKHEWETAKARGEIQIAFKATKKFNEDFAAKCAENGTNKNAVLKKFAYEYTYGSENYN